MADDGTLREPDPCCYCEGWDHTSADCPEQDVDLFVDADLWEVEAARVRAKAIADMEAREAS